MRLGFVMDYRAKQLQHFRYGMKVGDVVVVYSRQRVLGIAVMDRDDYVYCKNTDKIYSHRRHVRYVWAAEQPCPASRNIIDDLGERVTLKLIRNPNVKKEISQILRVSPAKAVPH